MGYIYLAIGVLVMALYLDDKAQRASVRELTGQVQHLEQAARDAEAAREAQLAALRDRQAAATETAARTYASQVLAITGRYKAALATLKEDVHGQITRAADSRCVVPIGAVVYHDRAAGGDADQGGAPVPEAAGGSLDAPSGTQLSDFAATVAGNYALARSAFDACAAEVTAWRSWYPVQRALFNQ